METRPRERLIDGMRTLLQTKGYAAAGLNELVALSGSPKGSIYHYFPGGKEQIAAESLRRSGKEAAAATTEAFRRHRSSKAAVVAIVSWQIDQLVHSNYRYGCPIATTALEAASESTLLQEACSDAYSTWLASLSEGLIANGSSRAAAERDSVVMLAAIEGALLLSRAQRSPMPLQHLIDRVDVLLETSSQRSTRTARRS